MRSILTVAAGGATALAMATFGAGAAVAGDRDVEKEGSCSVASDWELDLDREDGGIEAEFEVDSNVVGETWKAKLKHEGVRVAKKFKVTKPPDGSFELHRVVPNLAGNDVVVGKARNLTTGETCRGRAKFRR